MEAQLQIRHIGYQDDKPRFVVVRGSDMKWGSETALTPPEQTIVPGRPNNNLQQDLRWYLEQFLDLPLGAYLDTAERVQATLQEWGSACFDSLFQKQARDWFQDARRQGLENLTLKIASNDPRVLAWPWEALHDPEGGTLAHHCRIERQLSELHDPLRLPANLPKDRINILLVIARPYGDKDVGFHALSRPLVELSKAQNSPVHIDVLRPPTFDQLRQTLRDKPGFYHIVHFDGHGGYGTPGHTSPHAFKGLQGMLVFENDHAEPANVDAGVLSQLMAEHCIPIMVLNACQSAKIDEQADDAFASVAAALLKAGIRSVVAMGYNLYVSGAQQFVPAFYQRLLSSGNVAEAARAGRQAMLAHPERVCVLGEHNLQDWLVPVLYQQLPPGEGVLPVKKIPSVSPFAKGSTLQMGSVDAGESFELPDEAQYLGDYGFIGRERAVQVLERARLQQPQAAFLIHGMAGIGKTILAKGFLHWLYDTNGLAQALPNGGVFWFSFDEIRSVEYVINAMVDPLFGTNARAAPLPQKLEALSKALREHPFLLVWDNFESASGIAGTEVTALLPEDDRQLLKDLLKRLRSGKTKVLITSCSPENWLTPQECYRLPLSGLQGEELWEYCNAVVADLGLKIDRKQDDFQKLITELDGHPLAIRAILLRLPERKAADLLVELKQQFAGQEGDESTLRIGAALSLFDRGLPENFVPILELIGLHQHYIQQEIIKLMLKTASNTSTLSLLSACVNTLEVAGLLNAFGQNSYRMHPALNSYLNAHYSSSEQQQRNFIVIMSFIANHFIPKHLHEKHFHFRINAGNFYHALMLAKKLSMNESIIMLTESLAIYERQIRNYSISIILFNDLVSCYKKNGDMEGEAKIYNALGGIFYNQRDFKNAEYWFKKMQGIAEIHGNKQVNIYLAISHYNFGMLSHQNCDFTAAEDWYRKSLEISEELGDEKLAASNYSQLGHIYMELKSFAAYNYLEKAKKISEKLGDESLMADICFSLGQLNEGGLGIMPNYKVAIDYYKKSLHFYKNFNNNIRESRIYLRLGVISQLQSDYISAENHFKSALKITEKLGDEYESAGICHQLGRILNLQENHQDAATWYIKSLLIFLKNRNTHGAMLTANNYLNMLESADSTTQLFLYQRWADAQLDKFVTLDNFLSAKIQHMLQLLNYLEYGTSNEFWGSFREKPGLIKFSSVNISDAFHVQQDESLSAYEKIIQSTACKKFTFDKLQQNLREELGTIKSLPLDILKDSLLFAKENSFYAGLIKTWSSSNIAAMPNFSLKSDAVATLMAIVFLLRTHLKLKCFDKGQWKLLIEHKPDDSKLLTKLLKELESWI